MTSTLHFILLHALRCWSQSQLPEKTYLRSHLKLKRHFLAFFLKCPGVPLFSHLNFYLLDLQIQKFKVPAPAFDIWRFSLFQSFHCTCKKCLIAFLFVLPVSLSDMVVKHPLESTRFSFTFDSKMTLREIWKVVIIFYFYVLTEMVLRFSILSQCFIVEWLIFKISWEVHIVSLHCGMNFLWFQRIQVTLSFVVIANPKVNVRWLLKIALFSLYHVNTKIKLLLSCVVDF